jgi:hypothetical protein
VLALAQFHEWRGAVAWSIERRNQHVALVTMNTTRQTHKTRHSSTISTTPSTGSADNAEHLPLQRGGANRGPAEIGAQGLNSGQLADRASDSPRHGLARMENMRHRTISRSR